MKKKVVSYGLVFLLVILITFAVYSYLSEGIVYYLISSDITYVLEYLKSFEGLAVFLFIFLVILEVLFALIPPLVLYLAGGILFGPFIGGFYALLGNVIGAGLAFQISKNWIRNFIERRIPTKVRSRFDKASERYGPMAIFILRLNPFTTTDLVSYVAGVSKINFWKFLFSTALGLIPLVFIQSYLGKSVSENPFIFKMFIILSFLYVIIFIGLIVYAKFKKFKKNAKLSSNKKK